LYDDDRGFCRAHIESQLNERNRLANQKPLHARRSGARFGLIALGGADPQPEMPTRGEIERLLDAASHAPDANAAARSLAPLLADPDELRTAFLLLPGRNDFAAYALLTRRRGVTNLASPDERRSWHETLLASLATHPELVRDVLQVERYDAGLPLLGAATMNPMPFFRRDDEMLIGYYVDHLMERCRRKPEPVTMPMTNTVLLTTEEHELHLLDTFQLTAGLCDRLDLIAGSKRDNWRSRCEDLANWYRANEDYLKWYNGQNCFQLDSEAQKKKVPVATERRKVPKVELPPFLRQR